MTKIINHSLFILILSFCLLNIIDCRLTIHSPSELKQFFIQKYGQNSTGVPYSIANFGDIPYGRTLIGQLQTPTFLQNCIYEDIPNQNKTKKIILSQRNDCKFTQKALNTQKQGGIMSIIMDNVAQNPGRIIMVDDGHGSSVHIPTVLISKVDGEKILQFMKNQKVTLSVSFDTNKTDTVSVNLYLDIADRRNFVFLRKFQPYYNKIKQHVKLNINYATVTCSSCRQGDCYYNGAYCKKIIYGWVQNVGQIFIKQQLRQYFIYKQYESLWWSYMNSYDQHCSQTTQQPYLQQCSIQQMKSLGIDSDLIIKLVNQSFKQGINQVLQESQNQRYNSQVMYYPTIVVNNVTYRGNLQPFEVEELICNSLNGECMGGSNNETTGGHIVLWSILSVTGFLILLLFVLFCYRRIVRRQITNNMNKQVNQLVNQYITMYEADKFRGDQELIEKENQQN